MKSFAGSNLGKRKYHPDYVKKIRNRAGRKKSKVFESKDNPFDNITHRSKHQVIGKVNKGAKVNSNKARQASINKRKQSLLAEFRNIGKDNEFTDLRFGEHTMDMTEEEKALARFTKERKRRSKGFALDDDEDELTHFGQNLSTLPDSVIGAGYVDSDDEDEEQGRIDASIVARAHFGGGDDNLNEDGTFKKSKKEAMEEVMRKSKFFRLEKQEQRAKQADMLGDLDSDFAGLLKKLQATNNFRGKSSPDEETNDFALEARKLREESTVAASDRLLSPDEVVQKEKARLEELEAARLARMSDKVTSKPELNDESLESNFRISADFRQKRHQSTQLYGEEEEDEDIEDDDEEEEAAGDVVTQMKEGKKVKQWLKEEKRALKKETKSTVLEEKLPFTFKVPKDYGEFRVLVRNRTALEQRVILERMLACNHPSISASNGMKIQRLFVILLNHFEALCIQNTEAVLNNVTPKIAFIKQIDIVQGALFDLAQVLPMMAGRAMRLRLEDIRRDLLIIGKPIRPSHLLFFKLIGNIFPTSDFRHGVVTPCLLVMAECLSRHRVNNLKHVCSGLFLAGLVLHFISLSKRLVPELPSFLSSLYIHGFGLQDAAIKDVALQRLVSTTAGINVTCGALWNSSKDISYDPQVKLGLSVLFAKSAAADSAVCGNALQVLCRLSQHTAKLYQNLSSCVELTEPLIDITSFIVQSDSGKSCTPVLKLHSALTVLAKSLKAGRKPLARGVEVFAIKQLTPAFLDTKTLRTDYDEIKTLKKKLKREKAGAMKVLRKDAVTLAKERRRLDTKQDSKRSKRKREIMSMLEATQRDTNILSGKTRAPRTKKERRAGNKARTYGSQAKKHRRG